MVMLAAAVSLRFFRFGGVQKMVLSGVGAGFLLYVLSKVTEDLSKAELMHPIASAWLPVCRGRSHRLFGLAVPGGRVVAVVAARQRWSPAFRRRTPVRRHRSRLTTLSGPVLALTLGLAFAGAIDVATTVPAAAQSFTYNPLPPRPKPAPRRQ